MKKQRNNILEKKQLITREMKKTNSKIVRRKNKKNLFKSIVKTHYQMIKKKF